MISQGRGHCILLLRSFKVDWRAGGGGGGGGVVRGRGEHSNTILKWIIYCPCLWIATGSVGFPLL